MPEPEPQRIFLSPPELFPGDREALLEAFDSGWIAPVGPAITTFETAFVEHMGGGHAVALASGTAALHLALKEVGVSPGDEVICSTMSFVASANAIRYCGAEPVFIDSETDTWNMDPALLEVALKERAMKNQLPAAVEVVHAYGQCAQIDHIRELCQQYEVPLIEDAAEALGAQYQGQAAGTFAKVSAFSFNGNKIITSSGGGMLWTQDQGIAEHVRHLATQAREPDTGYLHAELGYNYRMSNLLAALGHAQLSNLGERVGCRRRVFEQYFELLNDLQGLEFMPEFNRGTSTRWLTCFTLHADSAKASPECIIQALDKDNIEARPVWRPLHQQPLYRECSIYGGSVAEGFAKTGVCLPSSGQLSEQDISRICAILHARLA